MNSSFISGYSNSLAQLFIHFKWKKWLEAGEQQNAPFPSDENNQTKASAPSVTGHKLSIKALH